MSLDYRKAGVDIDAGADLVDLIKPFAERTRRPENMASLGGFGGLFKLDLSRFSKPILVGATDGVGTKLNLAFATGILDTVGIDLVAMNVNDIVTLGAEPLFFLDYYATGKLTPADGATVIKGIAKGCEISGCSLLGGETAELPGFYKEGEFELAGFSVGVVNDGDVVDGTKVQPGDAVIGLWSSGLHSNGYSLARKIAFEAAGMKVDDPSPVDEGKTLGQTMLEPTVIYVKPILAALKEVQINAMAHITGGGLLENVPRVLPQNMGVVFDRSAWEIPALFKWMQKAGNVDWKEMFRVFNCGVGMAVIVPADQAEQALKVFADNGMGGAVIGHTETIDADTPAVRGLF